MITLLLFLVGLTALVYAAALVSPPVGWAVFGLACLTVSCWPAIRSRLT